MTGLHKPNSYEGPFLQTARELGLVREPAWSDHMLLWGVKIAVALCGVAIPIAVAGLWAVVGMVLWGVARLSLTWGG